MPLSGQPERLDNTCSSDHYQLLLSSKQKSVYSSAPHMRSARLKKLIAWSMKLIFEKEKFHVASTVSICTIEFRKQVRSHWAASCALNIFTCDFFSKARRATCVKSVF